MTNLTASLVCFAALTFPGAAVAQEALAHGKDIYQKWCAPCHAAVKPGERLAGTSALEDKYKGSKPAELERRTDLTPATVSYFVRNGVNFMPWFRKTEVGDDDLAALGAYLSHNNPDK